MEEGFEYVEGEELLFDFMDFDLGEGEFDDWEEEQEEDNSQVINLSWCGGTDPTLVQFPF